MCVCMAPHAHANDAHAHLHVGVPSWVHGHGTRSLPARHLHLAIHCMPTDLAAAWGVPQLEANARIAEQSIQISNLARTSEQSAELLLSLRDTILEVYTRMAHDARRALAHITHPPTPITRRMHYQCMHNQCMHTCTAMHGWVHALTSRTTPITGRRQSKRRGRSAGGCASSRRPPRRDWPR